MTDRPAHRWLTPPEVAERLGIDPAKVIGWIRRGELRGVNVASSTAKSRPRWRVSHEALATFLAGREARPIVTTARRRRQPADVIEFF